MSSLAHKCVQIALSLEEVQSQHNNDRLCIELENQGKDVNLTAAAAAVAVSISYK